MAVVVGLLSKIFEKESAAAFIVVFRILNDRFGALQGLFEAQFINSWRNDNALAFLSALPVANVWYYLAWYVVEYSLLAQLFQDKIEHVTLHAKLLGKIALINIHIVNEQSATTVVPLMRLRVGAPLAAFIGTAST